VSGNRSWCNLDAICFQHRILSWWTVWVFRDKSVDRHIKCCRVSRLYLCHVYGLFLWQFSNILFLLVLILLFCFYWYHNTPVGGNMVIILCSFYYYDTLEQGDLQQYFQSRWFPTISCNNIAINLLFTSLNIHISVCASYVTHRF